MTVEIAVRNPSNEELTFAKNSLHEVTRMLANLNSLKLEKNTELTENINSIKKYLKSTFCFIIDLDY